MRMYTKGLCTRLRQLTFLVSLVRLLPLAMTSPSFVITHLHMPQAALENALPVQMEIDVLGMNMTNPHPIGTSPLSSAFLACMCMRIELNALLDDCIRKWLGTSAHLSKGLAHEISVLCRP